MKTSSIIWLVVILAIVVIGGIWIWMGQTSTNGGTALYPTSSQSGTSATGTSASDTSGGDVPTGVIVLNTATSPTLGTYLVATNGMTLYKYTPDTPGKSNCTGGCAVAWPPYTVTSAMLPNLADGLGISGQLATFKRADGSLQLTYNGTPLYFYVKDKKAGDTTGQGVGGIWFVVAP